MLNTVIVYPESFKTFVDSANVALLHTTPDTIIVSLKSNLVDSVLVALHQNLNAASISSKDWLIAFTSIVAGIVSGLIVVIVGARYQRQMAEEQNKIAREQISTQNQNFREQLKSTTELTIKQLSANILSTARQKRIEDLRSLLTDFITTLGIIAALRKGVPFYQAFFPHLTNEDLININPRLSQEIEKILKLITNLGLYLDLNNSHDEALYDKLSETKAILQKKENYEELKKFIEDLLVTAGVFLKLESARVEKFE